MIVTINPVTVGDVTTDKAIVNLTLGNESVTMTLHPVTEIGGIWIPIEKNNIIPIIGLYPELFESFKPEIQTFIQGLGI